MTMFQRKGIKEKMNLANESADAKADSLLMRLIESPWTAIILLAGLFGIIVVFLLGIF